MMNSFLILLVIGASVLVTSAVRSKFDPSLPLPVHTHELFHDKTRSAKRRLGIGSELTPLYQGYGTHFSYIYVGTPPQRQSVIVDTGSHYTAFPCTGCQQCGKHTDSYFDIKKSSTSSTQKCGTSTCNIHQSYAEGSSWNAIKVQDQLWVGGLTEDLVSHGSNYSVKFTFGCQTSETGLFRTQLADGIMGMSMSEDVLPSQLFAQKVVDTRMFAMCFRVGGGIMTIGGVNQKIHKKGGMVSPHVPSLELSYAKLLHPPGSVWYTVNLLDIMLQPQDGSTAPESLGASRNQLNTGKGVIVDSGTTDTYLPASLKTKFTTAFNKLAGVYYTESDIKLTAAQLARMPNIVFVLENTDGKPFQITMPWTNYVDNVGNDKYAFRVYLTEGSGSVLGANFMSSHNVIFDRDNNRVGFASSSCIFEDFAKEDVQDEELGVLNETITGIDTENSSDGCTSVFLPTHPCSAHCDPQHSPTKYIAEGTQPGIDNCRQSKDGLDNSLPNKPCHELCENGVISLGRGPDCIVSKWSDCHANCSQWRVNYKNTRYAHMRSLKHSNSSRALDTFCGTSYIESRTCNAGSCPIKGATASDYLIFIDMKINIPAALWGYAYTNTFEETFAVLFMIPAGSLDILTSADSHDRAGFVKVRFEIRMRSSSFGGDIKKMVKTAEGIPAAVFLDDFNARFLQALVETSKRIDGIDFDRYGWLRTTDITIINSMAIPLGGVGPKMIYGSEGTIAGTNIVRADDKGYSRFEIVLILLIVCVGVGLLCMLYFHMRLREEHKQLSMQNMAYLQEYESKLFGDSGSSGGKAGKMIGKVWNGVKDGVKNALGGRSKGRASRDKSIGSTSNSIAHSMQSISSVISAATGGNTRTRDTVNPLRNSYKYDHVPLGVDAVGDVQLSSMERGARGGPELVVAGEDDSDQQSQSAEGSGSGSSSSEASDDEFDDSRLDLRGFKEVANSNNKY